jgi:hypothetical protein
MSSASRWRDKKVKMTYYTQHRNKRSKASLLCALCFIILVAICNVSRAGQEPAFVLSGKFEDIFADKHNNGGSFTVKAFESNALIDMTFENGFRQIVGTDGHDSFDYYPIGQAVISSGRFPTDADETEQFLWLLCVHDSELLTNLNNYRFPFYGAYNTNDIVSQVLTNSVPPYLITSIKWYAPNYDLVGRKHLEMAEYTKGFLRAELTVTKTNIIDNATIPIEFKFIQYNTRPTDSNLISNLSASIISKIPVKIPTRSPNDVVPVEYALFSITNIQVTSPLSSYIPEILDKTARVNDKRFPEMGVVKVVSSGKWWAARELYTKREASIMPHRKVILAILFTSFLFPIFLLIRMWKHGKIKQNENQ